VRGWHSLEPRRPGPHGAGTPRRGRQRGHDDDDLAVAFVVEANNTEVAWTHAPLDASAHVASSPPAPVVWMSRLARSPAGSRRVGFETPTVTGNGFSAITADGARFPRRSRTDCT